MKLKASLHIHTSEDKTDGHVIKYNVYKLIDEAKKYDFKILALTCHKKFECKKEHIDYAKKNGILLIPGVELALRKFLRNNDVLVLNCEENVEKIKNFADLIKYKKNHPEIFIIAPHPLFGIKESIGKNKLIKYINVFDAVENSWFYSKFVNFNKKAKKIAKKYKKPFISTSDAHVLTYFNKDYTIIETEKLNIESVFKAIKANKFTNITEPKSLYKLIFYIIFFKIKQIIFWPMKYELLKNK
ncbi:MAG: PHP domain-containing protein [Candidatus Falkowbacteria bacterium]